LRIIARLGSKKNIKEFQVEIDQILPLTLFPTAEGRRFHSDSQSRPASERVIINPQAEMFVVILEGVD
jgi:hypothetical protein